VKQTDNRQKQMVQSKAQKPHHDVKDVRDKHVSVPDTDHASQSPAAEKLEPIRVGPKIGRNDPCSCGSGKKYKKCCLGKA